MTVTKARINVECDRCKELYIYTVNKLTDLRKQMRADGWNCDTRDICPVCQYQKQLGGRTGTV